MDIFRIERTATGDGMWYDNDGSYNPFINTLSEGLSKDLPMDYDQRYGEDGLRWYSGCQSLEGIDQWFSNRDIVELIQGGFRLVRYDADRFHVEPTQVIFTKEHARLESVIPVETIWRINNPQVEQEAWQSIQ